MAEDDSTQADKRKWTLLLRRSFGVPDIIGDEVATKAIELMLRERHELNPMERTENPSPESAVIDALIAAGCSHQLDEALLGLDGGAGQARAAVNRHVGTHTKWELHEVYQAIELMTDVAVEMVRSYLATHPTDPLQE